MKKTIWGIIILSAFACIGNVRANAVHDVTMDIYIDYEGTAHVTEVWDATLTSGTEGYKPYYNLGNSQITNFSVSDENKNYVNIGSWDTSGSMSTKAYKNGLHYINNGVELCFGISKYGTHTYTMKYDITNFVAGLDDADMVYWTLFPYDFSVEPDNVYIKIYEDQAFADTLDVWGYGNYGGYAYVYDGYIEMSTNGKLSSDEYMTILVKFPKGTFNTSGNILNNDFNYYLEMAEEGTEHYEHKMTLLDVLGVILNLLFSFLPFVIVFLVIRSASSEAGAGTMKLIFGKNGKKLPKDIPLYRDIPCNKDIFRAYWVAVNYNLMEKKTDFLGAVLLKWLKEGQISIEKEEKGLLKKEQSIIVFNGNFISSNTYEVELYQMMVEASRDERLEEHEFKTWCNTNYNKILKWFDKVADNETKKLIAEGKIEEKTQSTLKIFKVKVYNVNPIMLEEATQMKGLKQFLKEFSLIDKREAIEVTMWEEYLMYAQIFGIADKVAKQFKKLYPEVITDYSYDSVIFVHNVSYSGMHSASSARSRAESYSSGGGGFSSGGGGGGSFGGGGGGGFR